MKLAQASELAATDPQAAAELKAQASEQYNNWKEGGALRVLAHTVIGGLTGDLSGALGAGSSALAAGKLNELTDNLPAGVRQAVGAGLAAGLGYLTGGNSGMSAAVNQDFNNRQLHPDEKRIIAEMAQEMACKGNPQCTQADIKRWQDNLETAALVMVDTQSEEDLSKYLNSMAWLQDGRLGDFLKHGVANDQINQSMGELASAFDALQQRPEFGQKIPGTGRGFNEDISYFQASERQRDDYDLLMPPMNLGSRTSGESTYPKTIDDIWGPRLERIVQNYESPFGRVEQVLPELDIIGGWGLARGGVAALLRGRAVQGIGRSAIKIETIAARPPVKVLTNAERYSGGLVRVNVIDADAVKLAERIGGTPSVRFANDVREFDAISSQYIAQAKPGNIQLGSALREQMRATFEAAQSTNKSVYYHFNGPPQPAVINKLNEYSIRYGVKVVIDTKPF